MGTARIQLEAIAYLLDVDEATPLVDYKGQSQGELLVSVVPQSDHVDLEELEVRPPAPAYPNFPP